MQNAQLHNQGRVYDPTTAGVQTSFGPDAYPRVNDPGFHANWQANPHMRHPFSTQDNTSLRKALTFVLQTAARETVTIAPDNPWLGRLAPAVRTDELTIKKDILDIVRNIAPFGPHFGPTRKQRVRTMTRTRQQTRKTWGMTIEKTQLFSAEGNTILGALVKGVRETVASTFIYETQMELLASGEEYREENYKFGNNPFQNLHGMQGIAQENAMLGFYQIRRDMYGALSKSGDQFRAVLDRVIDVLKRRNAVPDALIVGPGIKARLTLGDTNNTQYYIAGDAGTFLRVNGSSSIDTYLGLDIIETLPVNPDEEIRSTFSREVEVGEFALLTRSPNSSGADFKAFHRAKQIYSERSDSMETITLAHVVDNCASFDENGQLTKEIYDLANEHNAGALSYKRIHGLTSATQIKPSKLSLFIYEDNNNMARVAKVWGQIEGLGGADGLERLVHSVLGGSGMTPAQFSQYSEAIEAGLALADQIKAIEIAADTFARGNYNAGQLAKDRRAEHNAVIDALGNQFGGLTPNDPATIAGQANGAGMQTLAQEGNAVADAFVKAISAVVRHSRRALGGDPRAVTPAWFHKPNAISAFIDILLGAQLPIWLAAAGDAAAEQAAARIPNFDGVEGTDLAAVERALAAPGVAFNTAGVTAAAARVQNELLRVVAGDNESDAMKALNALQEISALSSDREEAVTGLSAISFRSARIFIQKQVFILDGFYGLISHMLSNQDLSPASYMAIGWNKAKKSAEHLMRIAAHIAEMNNASARAYIQEGIAAYAGENETDLKKWFKKTPKIAQANTILDAHVYNFRAGDVEAPGTGFVRTPLTVSKGQLQRILRTAGLVAGNNFRVSHPDAPWTFVADAAGAAGVSDNNPFRQGGAGIGGQLEMHEQTFFAQFFEPLGDDLDEVSTFGRKRGRGYDSDDEDDYGYGGVRPSKARDPMEIALVPESFSDVRGMDLGGASSSSASSSIGARFAGTRQTREAYELERLGMGRKYNEMVSSTMAENYDASQQLGSALERMVAQAILYSPINKKTAKSLAEASDAPFGGFIARPHIRHLMSTAMVVESGPSTALTHYTETDISTTATNSKEWIFNLTWQSTPFVHAPQFTEIFHDACALGYVGGNDTSFFKRSSDRNGPQRVYDPEFGAQASIYAFLIGAYEDLPNPTSLTGIHHVTGYDNNANAGSIPVPHYTGAPLAEKVWGFSKLAKQMTRVGFVDQLANTLVFRGLTYGHTGSQIPEDFRVEQENTGHWGKVEPNKGLANVRKGSAIIQQ